MSEENEATEKSFEPTPKKLEEARRQGEIPKSTDLSAAGMFAGFVLCLLLLGEDGLSSIAIPLSEILAEADRIQIADGISDTAVTLDLFRAVAPVLATVFLLPAFVVMAALAAQRAIAFSPKKLEPKLSRISPIQGLKNKFGPNGLFEFLKSVVKLYVISFAAAWFIIGNLEEFLISLTNDHRSLTLRIGHLIIQFVFVAVLVNLAMGGVDYLWQIAQHRKKNMMSRKDIEDETKDSEGDPHLKQKRRSRAAEIATNHMLADVPTADVVIVNPTHFSVALKWDRSSKGAPVCVAKGIDQIAARIRETANGADVPIFSDPPTARALFAVVDIGQVIQPEHYKAVAAAIRFAEQIQKKGRKS